MAEVKVAKVVVYPTDDEQFRFRALGGNGEPIAYGESYTREENAAAAAKAVAGGAPVVRPDGTVLVPSDAEAASLSADAAPTSTTMNVDNSGITEGDVT